MTQDPSQPDARTELLSRLVARIADTGLTDMSVRELAESVGSSHRMINYHFGGRDGLVAAIVAETESRQRDALTKLAKDATSPDEVMRNQWDLLVDPALRAQIRLFFEVFAMAIRGRPGTEGFLDTLIDPWLEVGEDAATRVDAVFDSVDLRLGIAVVRGLLIDVLASGDTGPATTAMHRFIDTWTAQQR